MSDDKAHAFLNLTGTDHLGRTAQDYLKFNAHEWEQCHNHVQWAFPSHVASAYNPDAPVLTNTRDFVKDMTVLETLTVKNLVISFMEMLGITVKGDRFTVSYEDDGAGNYYPRHWMTPYNHNYLRLTRVLNLLYHMDIEWCEGLYRELLAIAKDHPDAISRETLLFWGNASVGNI